MRRVQGRSRRPPFAATTGCAVVLGGLLSGLVLMACEPRVSAPPNGETAAPVAPAPDMPNVIVVTVDTLRVDRLGAYGYARDTSPALDRLAADGILFDQAVTPIPKTTPALTSLLSGLYPKTHRSLWLGVPVDSTVPFLSEGLQSIGFATMGICGQHNCHADYGMSRGFDLYDDEFAVPYARGTALRREGGSFHPGSEKRAEEISDRALEWIEDRDVDRPFFLWLHYMDPHAGYAAPPPFDTMFDSSRDGVAPSPALGDSAFGLTLPENRVSRQAAVPGVLEYGYYLDRYDGEIRYADHHIGRVLDRLRELGLYDDALILFTSDHGEYMGELRSPMRAFDHGHTTHDSEFRIPMIVKLPENEHAGSRDSSLVSLVDVVPTVLDVLEVEHGVAEGTSMVARNVATPRSVQFIQMPHPQASFIVRDGERKVVFRTRQELDALLGNLDAGLERYAVAAFEAEEDPLGRRNVVRKRPALAKSAADQLSTWLAAPPPLAKPATEQREPNPEAIRHLRALGYVE